VTEIEGDWIFHLEADGLFLLVSRFDRGKYSDDAKETVLIPWSNVVSITQGTHMTNKPSQSPAQLVREIAALVTAQSLAEAAFVAYGRTPPEHSLYGAHELPLKPWSALTYAEKEPWIAIVSDLTDVKLDTSDNDPNELAYAAWRRIVRSNRLWSDLTVPQRAAFARVVRAVGQAVLNGAIKRVAAALTFAHTVGKAVSLSPEDAALFEHLDLHAVFGTRVPSQACTDPSVRKELAKGARDVWYRAQNLSPIPARPDADFASWIAFTNYAIKSLTDPANGGVVKAHEAWWGPDLAMCPSWDHKDVPRDAWHAAFTYVRDAVRKVSCDAPPKGWECTRDPNHEGSCVAVYQGADGETETYFPPKEEPMKPDPIHVTMTVTVDNPPDPDAPIPYSVANPTPAKQVVAPMPSAHAGDIASYAATYPDQPRNRLGHPVDDDPFELQAIAAYNANLDPCRPEWSTLSGCVRDRYRMIAKAVRDLERRQTAKESIHEAAREETQKLERRRHYYLQGYDAGVFKREPSQVMNMAFAQDYLDGLHAGLTLAKPKLP
jgi:hypothetical protein